jgi:hypothetical protein
MATPAKDLPSLDDDYPLAVVDIRTYGESGHVMLRGLCAWDEVAAYRSAIVDAAMRHCRETRPLEERDTYGKAFLQVMNLWRVDETVRRFVFARRFAGVAARLMGVDGVRLYHDQALFKEPGGGHTPWHQDQYYWPLDTDRTITLWMPLVDVDERMGSMTFADGSQRDGFVPMADEISDASEAFFDTYVREKGYPLSGGVAMAAGDATFHAGFTLHRAPGNVTDRTREVMTIIYYPDGTRVAEPANDWQREDKRVWLDDLPPGSLAAGDGNPILYHT